MIDYGLLVSMALAIGVPAVMARRWEISGPGGPVAFLDVATVPALAGLAVGRLVTLALDDPGSIGSLADMLIIRSGVEFWPGVAAAASAAAVGARVAGVEVSRRLAELVAPAMVGYAAYEAACVLRDGCFGPVGPVGLRPPGVSTVMVPVGLFMGAGVAVGAVAVHRLVERRRPVGLVLGVAAVVVATVRSVGSIWLPHVGDGPTRQHLTSIVVALVAVAVTAVSGVVARSDRPPGDATVDADGTVPRP